MSIVEIGIMVEVYRHLGGEVDEQTHQELLDMLASSHVTHAPTACLPWWVGDSAYDGAGKGSTNHDARLGCAISISALHSVWSSYGENEGQVIWGSKSGTGQFGSFRLRHPATIAASVPRPASMANLNGDDLPVHARQGPTEGCLSQHLYIQVCQDMIDIMAENNLRNMLGAASRSRSTSAQARLLSYDVPWGDTRGEVGIVFHPELPAHQLLHLAGHPLD